VVTHSLAARSRLSKQPSLDSIASNGSYAQVVLKKLKETDEEKKKKAEEKAIFLANRKQAGRGQSHSAGSMRSEIPSFLRVDITSIKSSMNTKSKKYSAHTPMIPTELPSSSSPYNIPTKKYNDDQQ